MALVIRTFRREDLDQVIAIEKASFPDPYNKLIFRWLKLKVGQWFVVAQEERIVGYAISEIRDGRGHIISMAVSPKNRRSGIGAAPLRELIKRLGPTVREIHLEVRVGNEAAISLYEKFSFRKTGEIKKRYYPDGEDAMIMARSA